MKHFEMKNKEQFLSYTLKRSSLLISIQSNLISLKISNLFQEHCQPAFLFASLKNIALLGVLSLLYALSLSSIAIKVFPELKRLIAVLALQYFAHCIKVALCAILSIPVLVFLFSNHQWHPGLCNVVWIIFSRPYVVECHLAKQHYYNRLCQLLGILLS